MTMAQNRVTMDWGEEKKQRNTLEKGGKCELN